MFDRKALMRRYSAEYRRRNRLKISADQAVRRKKKAHERHAPDQNLILGPYKEPLRKVEKGFGYEGALTFDVKGRLQCHVCGMMHDNLGLHLRSHNNISAPEYRTRFKLSPTTALISERQREKYKMQAFIKFGSMSAEQKAERKMKSKARWREWYDKEGREKMAKERISLETKNKRGICPDQLLTLIKGAYEYVGKDNMLSQNDFIDYYKTQRYMEPIRRTFGSWKRAVKACGFGIGTSGKKKGTKYKRYSDDELLDLLNGFYLDTGRIPMSSDCRRGFLPMSSVFVKHFGSFAEARKKAGLKDWYDRRGDQGQNARQIKVTTKVV